MTRALRTTLTAAVAAALVVVAVTPAHAAVQGIEGTVVAGDTSTALEGIMATAYELDGDFAGSAITNAAGYFGFEVPSGDYRVQFTTTSHPTYASQWSGGSVLSSGAATLTVTNAFVTANAVLAKGGTVSGTITTSFSGPVGAQAFAYDAADGTWQVVGNPTVDSLAPSPTPYQITGIPAGQQIKVRFQQPCEGEACTVIPPVWNGGAISGSTAPAITVASGGTVVSNITMSASRSIPSSRLAGGDRYATSALIADEYDPADVDLVYLASGVNFPDALSAAPAAAFRKVPLLLTDPLALPAVISDALERLDPARIVVAGGEGAVSDDVVAEVEDLLPDVEIVRIGGADRFETSRLLSLDAFGDGADQAWIATGLNFADALAAAPVAGSDGAPVLLVNGTDTVLDGDTADLLAELGVTRVNIAGGTATVSAGIQSDLDAVAGVDEVTRAAGVDRYQTAQIINMFRWISVENAYLASGMGFADALSGAALAGREGLPMYTVPGPCMTWSARNMLWQITPAHITVFGGPAVVSNAASNLVTC